VVEADTVEANFYYFTCLNLSTISIVSDIVKLKL